MYPNYIPILTTVSPKKRIMRQRSQPKPVLSGQLTVIIVGSPSSSDCLINTASSYNNRISFVVQFFDAKRLNFHPIFSTYETNCKVGLRFHFRTTQKRLNLWPTYGRKLLPFCADMNWDLFLPSMKAEIFAAILCVYICHLCVSRRGGWWKVVAFSDQICVETEIVKSNQ